MNNVKMLLDKANRNDKEAQYQLGKIYSMGNTKIEKDTNKSIEWYQKAASNGHTGAQVILGKF